MRLVVIGSSRGGLNALQLLLPALAPDFPWPIAVAQHRVRDANLNLAGFLQKGCRLRVREPDDKELIEPGFVYLAPADYHLLVDGDHFALSTGAPNIKARPSIDILFETAAEAFGPRTIGIVLTGSNSDGSSGLRALKIAGGVSIVQDPTTAESAAMPTAALTAAGVDLVLPLAEIAPFLNTIGLGAKEVTHAV